MTAPKSTITEDVTAQVDGVEVDFVVSGGPFIAGTLVVEMNGVRQREGAGNDFVESGATGFTMAAAPEVGDTLQVQYEIEDFGVGFPLVVASGRDC